ncbi:hypothetical protein MMC18_001294 [Xylographa bjoerkii]|nr:hypothetical protein [Xylographa bjoerkii]
MNLLPGFFINLPVGGVAAAFLFLFHVPNQIPKDKFATVVRTILLKLDLIGFSLFAPAAIMFLLALQYATQRSLGSSAAQALPSSSSYFWRNAWVKRMGEEAIFPFSMISKRVVWCSSLVMFFLMSLTFVSSYYLPIWFQTVKVETPLMSGVDLFPGILVQLLFAMLLGVLVTKLGYYLPWSVVSGALIAIASGLFSTFSPTTSVAKWVGYQIILGAGQGMGIQMVSFFPFPFSQSCPVTTTYLSPIFYPCPPQHNNINSCLTFSHYSRLLPTQIALAMSLLMFSNAFGGALFLAAGNTAIANSLRTELSKYAPSVDPQVVINAGATGFRNIVAPDQIVGVLLAYSASIDHVFYLSASAGVAAFIVAWGIGWADIRAKKTVG